MTPTTKRTLWVLGAVAAFICTSVACCCGLGSYLIHDAEQPELTELASFDCGGRTLRVMRRHVTTNWLAGAGRTDWILRFGRTPRTLDVEGDTQPAPLHLPQWDRPAGTHYGSEVDTINFFLDPSTISAADALRFEHCAESHIEPIRQALARVDYPHVEPPHGRIYWRARPGVDFERSFRDGERSLHIVRSGAMYLIQPGRTSLVAHVVVQLDHPVIELSDDALTGFQADDLTRFRDDAGRDPVTYFGATVRVR